MYHLRSKHLAVPRVHNSMARGLLPPPKSRAKPIRHISQATSHRCGCICPTAITNEHLPRPNHWSKSDQFIFCFAYQGSMQGHCRPIANSKHPCASTSPAHSSASAGPATSVTATTAAPCATAATASWASAASRARPTGTSA